MRVERGGPQPVLKADCALGRWGSIEQADDEVPEGREGSLPRGGDRLAHLPASLRGPGVLCQTRSGVN